MTTEPLSIFTILNQVNQVIALYYNLSKHQVSNSLGNPVGDERAVKAKIGLIRKEIYFNPFYQYASDFISLKIKEVIEGTGNQEIDEVLQDKNC